MTNSNVSPPLQLNIRSRKPCHGIIAAIFPGLNRVTNHIRPERAIHGICFWKMLSWVKVDIKMGNRTSSLFLQWYLIKKGVLSEVAKSALCEYWTYGILLSSSSSNQCWYSRNISRNKTEDLHTRQSWSLYFMKENRQHSGLIYSLFVNRETAKRECQLQLKRCTFMCFILNCKDTQNYGAKQFS